MSWDKKDRAILVASALVGFSQSVSSLSITAEDEESEIIFRRWRDALLQYAERTAKAIDEALNDSKDGGPDGN